MAPLKVFVISLQTSLDRRSRVTDMLKAIGLEFEFFDAVDGRSLDHKTYVAPDAPWELLPGEVGCYLSHLGVWRKVVNERVEVSLVLEDDALFDASALLVIDACINSAQGWDAIRLSSIEKQVGLVVRNLVDDFKLILPTKSPSGLAGYLIRHSGAERMLAAYSKILMPIDTAVDEYWRHALNIPLISPAVIHHRQGLVSTIGHEAAAARGVRRGFAGRIFRSIFKKLMIACLVRKYWGRSYGRWRFDG